MLLTQSAPVTVWRGFGNERSHGPRNANGPALLSVLALLSLLGTGCALRVTVLETPDYTVYRDRLFTVYLSKEFVTHLMGPSHTDSSAGWDGACYRGLGDLFARRVLRGDMFWRAMDLPPSEPAIQVRTRRKATAVDEALGEETGPVLKVLNCIPRDHDGPAHVRSFELWVTFDAAETGGGSFSTFRLDVSGPANALDDRTFLARGRVRALTYSGDQL